MSNAVEYDSNLVLILLALVISIILIEREYKVNKLLKDKESKEIKINERLNQINQEKKIIEIKLKNFEIEKEIGREESITLKSQTEEIILLKKRNQYLQEQLILRDKVIKELKEKIKEYDDYYYENEYNNNKCYNSSYTQLKDRKVIK